MTDSDPRSEEEKLIQLRQEVYGQYDQQYFDGKDDSTAYGEYSDSWIWGPIAEILLRYTDNTMPLLDWGCAKGYLVETLVERGLNAWGVDVSEYAISQASDWVRDNRLRVISRPHTQFSDGYFSTIVSFETLEHIHEQEIDAVIREMRRVSRKWFFGSIFLDHQTSNDPTHITVKPRSWWDQKFQEHGYLVRDDIARVAMEYPVFKALGLEVFCYVQEEPL